MVWIVAVASAVGLVLLPLLFQESVLIMFINAMLIALLLSSMFVLLRRQQQIQTSATSAQDTQPLDETLRYVTENSGSNAIATAELSFAISDLVKVISAVNERLDESAASANQAQQQAEQINLATDSVAATTEQTKTISERGKLSMQQLANGITKIVEQNREAAATLDELQQTADKIAKVTDVIESIAEQTNLLALNASIESARAGEHGRGFAVVADEVRTLAGRTGTATVEVSELVASIRTRTSAAVTSIRQLAEDISVQAASSEQLSEQLQQLAEQSSDASEKVATMASLSTNNRELMQANADNVLHALNDLSTRKQQLGQVEKQAKQLEQQSEQLFGLLVDENDGTEHGEIFRLARAAADQIEVCFENALARNELTREQLFDRSYQPVEGVSPAKYETAYTAYLAQHLPPIQEPVLGQNSDLIYAITTDPNGYVARHNDRFNQPLTGDYEQDLVGNRSRRIFDDPTGSRCGAHTQKLLLQTYKRDTGEVMHDLSVPIYVEGKHWGGFRVGYRPA